MSGPSQNPHHALAAIPLSVAVSACGIIDPGNQSGARPPPPPTPRPTDAATPGGGGDAARAARAANAATARPAPAAPAPPTAPDLKVVGLNQSETEALLGQPQSSIDRPPAKVWQYRTRECAVDVYFYLDVGRNDFYALHYDTPAP